MVALIGATGAGKTTVVSLLLSYYDPDRGEVLLDGRALSGFGADQARRPFAAVLQEPMLFNATIGENTRYGRLGASDEQVRAAAAAAGADAFIRALPEGYDAAVGPRGAPALRRSEAAAGAGAGPGQGCVRAGPGRGDVRA